MSQTLAGAVKDLILKSALEKALSLKWIARLLAVPVLGVTLNPLVTWAISWVLNWALTETAIGGAVVWFMITGDLDVKNVEKSTALLKDMLLNPKKYTDKQMAQIEGEFDEDALRLIRLRIFKL